MAPGRHSKEIFSIARECASRELIKLIGKLRWIRKGEAKDAERKLRATSGDMEAAWRAWIGTISSPSRILDSGAQGPDAVTTSADTLQQALAPVDQLLNANPLHDVVPVDWAAIAASLRILWVRALRDPQKAAASMIGLQIELWSSASKIWVETAERWSATLAGGGAEGGELPREKDRRFSDPQWQANPFFRILRESYSLASEWLLNQDEGKDLSPEERQRLNFHLRQFIDATSPTLMLASNPTALKKAFETGGLSIAEGLNNLARDIKEGRLSMVDANAFAPGRNLALTPGKVVYRNRLIELIQYEPQTKSVYERPILFIPPWINKYYILDLQPKNSLIGHLVRQGFAVFVISWKNPDASMDGITIEDYMELGPLAANDVVREITGAKSINVMGYCIGGTLLAMTLAFLAAKGDGRFNAATFMVSLQDFSRVGDTAVFMGEDSVDFIEQQMLARGYLDSREMANIFNLLRANDLIWSNVVNNYLLGNKPPAFDLLYWNSDGTRMARTAHSWYLNNTYVENNLIKPGCVQLKGVPVDLSKITIDIYAVGAEADHIVPWSAAWQARQLFGGAVRFVLASSGHIAGIINPPGGKGAYWADDGDAAVDTPEAWRQSATKHDGSWWNDWIHWLGEHSGNRRALPAMGSEVHPVIENAPGSYVLEK